MRRTLLIRADAGSKIGTGHVMRCLALAQAWQDSGGRAVFAMGRGSPALIDRLISEGMEVFHLSADPGSPDDARKTAYLAHDVDSDWVVVDGYHFGSNYQMVIKRFDLRLLFIDDDGHADYYYADIVLNQNLHANEDLYKNREPHTKLLLGTQYMLLRREFWSWRGWNRETPKVARKVLITLGGSDPDNVTIKIVRALQQIGKLEIVVIIGGNNSHYEKILSVVDGNRSVCLKKNVKNMPKLLAWADLAVSSAGVTAWEIAFMGLPSLVLILAENQVKVAEKLASSKIAMNLGWHNLLSPVNIIQEVCSLAFDTDARASMSEFGRQIIDGFGVSRVLAELLKRTIWLRTVCESDREQIYEWANDPDSREASFSTDPIPWKEHALWFESKIQDTEKTVFYVAHDVQNQPLGTIRFDLDGRDATINLNLVKSVRGQGLASLIINEAVKKLFIKRNVFRVNAFIKPHNIKSIRAFEKSGFTFFGHKTVKEGKALNYTLLRKDNTGDEK